MQKKKEKKSDQRKKVVGLGEKGDERVVGQRGIEESVGEKERYKDKIELKRSK